MMLDSLDTQGGGGVGLAGAWAADQHDVLGAIQKLAFVQLAQRGLIDLTGGKVKAREVLVSWEARSLHVIGDRPHLALS